jgi:hypothetical protein
MTATVAELFCKLAPVQVDWTSRFSDGVGIVGKKKEACNKLLNEPDSLSAHKTSFPL